MLRVTPPPAHLVRKDVLEGVKARAQMVASALGLNGLAQLDAFMHAESADLVVVAAHAVPDMSSTSDIFQQVGPWGSLMKIAYSAASAAVPSNSAAKEPVRHTQLASYQAPQQSLCASRVWRSLFSRGFL